MLFYKPAKFMPELVKNIFLKYRKCYRQHGTLFLKKEKSAYKAGNNTQIYAFCKV
jgi:hypothetical protein